MRVRVLLFFLLAWTALSARADDPKSNVPILVDSAGKELALKSYTISSGTRKLPWRAAQVSPAPDAIVFRDLHSTLYVEGVVTLIPLSRLESLTYDVTRQTVSAKVAGVEKPLEGSIRYREINQLTIEAEVDRGSAGVVALKYRAGLLKGGIQSVRFPGAQAGAKPTGETGYVTVADKGATHTDEVQQLQALYKLADGKEILSPSIMFKKTFKVNLADVVSLKVHEDAKASEIECDLVLKDGSEQTLTLLTTMPIDGKDASLEGLLGVVPAGDKIYPVRCISSLGQKPPKADDPPKTKKP